MYVTGLIAKYTLLAENVAAECDLRCNTTTTEQRVK